MHSNVNDIPYLTFYRSKEIEFTVPPGAFSFTPPRARRGNQTLDIPTKNGPSLSPSDAHTGNNVRQRRFSTALLFPGRVDGTSSPLLSPSILLHCSAPSSPIPNYSPSPSHSPCLSPLPSVHTGKAFVFIFFFFFYLFWLIHPHQKSLFPFPVLVMLTAFQLLPGKKSKSSAITYTITCEGSVTSDYLEPQFSRFVR